MPSQTNPSYGILLGLFIILSTPISAQQVSPPPPPYNYNPPMATVLIVLIVLFFSVGFLSIYIRHIVCCLGVDLFGRDQGGGFEGWRSQRPQGLDPAVIEALPTFLYSDVKVHRIGNKSSSLECAICLNEFSDHEMLRLLPACSHVFHPHCIGPWLVSHATCPVCRENLEAQESNNSMSIDSLAHQLDQSFDEEELLSQPSDQITSNDDHHTRDVIIRIGGSPENVVMKSPVVVHEVKGVDGRMGKLPRSHSTGHSLVEDCERYTLRLPKEVRNKLANVNNNNLSGLPAAMVSPRVGYRARSVGCTGMAIKPDRWHFSASPPFISKSGLAWSPKPDEHNNDNNNNYLGFMRSPKGLFKSIKSPLDRVVRPNDIGEQSSDRLWPNRSS